MSDRTIIKMGESAGVCELGGKAAALAALGRSGLPIPPWVVVTPAAFSASLSTEQKQILDNAEDIDAVQQVLNELDLNAAVLDELHNALASLGLKDKLLAARSSAVDEDGSGHSFAGQFESYLAVTQNRLAERIVDVWRSGFTDRVLAYRKERGLSLTPTPPTVLVQEFVDAQASGVAFGADPISGRRGIAVVSAVYGLGTALVGGDASADTWRVNRTGRIVEKAIVTKTVLDVPDTDSPTGTRPEPVEENRQNEPAIKEDTIQAVAALARRTGQHFGIPQDIEWVVRDGELMLLQSRPITSLQSVVDPDGGLQLWDNSNIAESYSGITTPLTFSFARRAYEGVYREFCLLLRVKRSTVEAHGDTFANMLGLIRGRVYYNLLNWYRMLSLLPGFAANRKFMEQMMGVREGLPEEMLAEFAPAGRAERWRDMLRLVRVGLALIYEHIRLPRSIKRFYDRLDHALRETTPPLPEQKLDELAKTYGQLERSLITRWDAPLVNDFLAMIFFGVLRSLTGKWSGDDGGQLHNHLLCSEGGIISAEPAKRIRAMAELAAADQQLVDTLCESEAGDAVAALRQHADLNSLFNAYRDKFGDRCLEELKLESQTLMDDPTPLLRSIGYAARRDTTEGAPVDVEQKMRADAERQIGTSLRGHPLRRLIFGWVLRNTRSRVRDRENLRFERTRLFGRVRRIFMEMGRRLTAEGLLDQPRDVFYLEVDELINFVKGTATSTNLSALVGVRRAEFDAYQTQPAPADRFETRGAVPVGNTYTDTKPSHSKQNANVDGLLRGIGACPGVVRGRIRVIRDPRGIELSPGTIVVAERTDPGWIMLFPAAEGMLVEHGSLLSHSAIVSRELGVPSIVSIPNLTETLRDGQLVEMDGQQGTIHILDKTTEADVGNGSQ